MKDSVYINQRNKSLKRSSYTNKPVLIILIIAIVLIILLNLINTLFF